MSNYNKIQQSILIWFKKNKRRLPWRQNRNWYKVWISEIMLQQTQVEQVINYYNNFITKFPTVHDLANADLQDVLKVWEGLGYYSRARNLYKAAKIIAYQYNGEFPKTKIEIIKLPGIGEYTANAILSLVYNQSYSVVDGNVIRVISRLFGISDNVRLSTTLKKIKSMTDKLLPANDSANFNEAMMELGALICLPKNPFCQKCPVMSSCLALENNLINIIPFKNKKAAKPSITVIIQIYKQSSKYYIVKRKDHGLLGGFWEFPIKIIENIQGLEAYNHKKIFNVVKHSYTHFNLLMYPVLITKNELHIKENLYTEFRWIELNKIRDFPIHRAMQKILEFIENN
jgi:A/G-specific adenine glycosylase